MKITTTFFEGVYVRYDGTEAVLGFSTKPQEARARFLLEMKQAEGPFELRETPCFETVGPMLDMSRNRVLTVEGVKRYLRKIQTLGMNMLMLYTEDLFEVEEYPQFGYLRGRYSIAELQELDAYAKELGIELIPCIQTFGHLNHFIRHPEGRAISENNNVLLPGSEETYRFIEAELKAIRKAFSTHRIHLGMDETFGLGRGKYMDRFGYRDPGEIYRDHVKRVLELTEKYFERPMIWSDMLFSNPTGRAYDGEYVIEQSVVDDSPEVDLVFWEYSREHPDFYRHVLKQHARFKGETAFAGGVWAWNGAVPNFDYTMLTTKAALTACAEAKVKTVIATLWVSGGCGADLDMSLPGLCAFSEYCYKGPACTDADIFAASKALCGVDEPLSHALSAVYQGVRSASSLSIAFLYGDPLLDYVMWEIDYPAVMEDFRSTLALLEQYPDYEYKEFYRCFYTICLKKADLYLNLQKAYKAGDRATLQRLADGLPALLEEYRCYYRLFKALWKRDYKPFGMENYTHDLGGVMQRLEDTREILCDYLKGAIPTIEELEPERLPPQNRSYRSAASYIAFYKAM